LRIGQILANLVGNAVKFTERGRVRLSVAADPAFPRTDPAESVHLLFSVSDTGIGIREEFLADLFKPFSQADQSTTRRFGGTGLGLSISKSYIELMGGELSVKSVYGQGSDFTFGIPLAVAPVEAVEESEAGVSRIASGLTVLVVDDDAVNRRVAMHLLEELGARPSEAESGHAAITALGRRSFDLVLMDCMMPAMDGYETTRRLRDPASGALNPKLPIVAMTARVQAEDRIRCLEAGMDDFVGKPLSLRSLDRVFRAVFGAGPGQRAQTAKASPPSSAVFAASQFTARYEGARSLGREILTLYLAQVRPLQEEANKARTEARLGDLADCMHRLKGSSGAIGGDRVARIAGSIEQVARGTSPNLVPADLDGLLAEFDAALAALETEIGAYLRADGAEEARD
jgi:CheY-like chemotaxis protein